MSQPSIHSIDASGKYHSLNKLSSDNIQSPPAGKGKPVGTPGKGPSGKPPHKIHPMPPTHKPTPGHTAINYTACAQVTDSNCIRQIYGFDNYVPKATNINKVAATGYLGQYFQDVNVIAGLQEYTVPKFGPQAVNDVPTVISVNGGTNPRM